MRRLNYRHIVLGGSPENETVGVRLKDGSYQYIRWLGFVDLDTARGTGKPVKLQVIRVTAGDGLGEWQRLNGDQFAQGCLVNGGVYGDLDEGKPRVVGH